MEDDERTRREDAARRLWDMLAVKTEHQDLTNLEAFRQM
jgi:hypothetical protein